MLCFGNTSLQDGLESKMAQDWNSQQTERETAPQPTAMQNLRPLSLGEILDATFAIYRSRFWLFSGIAAAYAVTALVLQLLNLLARHFVIVRHGFQSGTAASLIGGAITGLLLLLPYAITQAGTVYALSEVYLGKGTSAMEATRAVIGKWHRYIGIAIWVSFSALWLPGLLWVPAFVLVFVLKNSSLLWLAGLLLFLGTCALPYSVWSILRNILGVQAAVIEGATVRTAMRRSKILTVGAKGRIFVVLLIVFALSMTAGVLTLPLMFVVLKAPLQEHNVATSIQLIVNALAQMVVTPVGLIGLSLVYFDQRVRQEGFDLLLMLGPEQPVVPASPVVAAGLGFTEATIVADAAEDETHRDDGSI
jgi:hypothetical protein